jgi:hypothetical protein
MTMKIQGDVFIVPNSLATMDEFLARSTREHLAAGFARLGIVDPGRTVQVWYTGAGCDNWESHRWPGGPGNGPFFGQLPGQLPTSIFHGKVEGDKVNLLWRGRNAEEEDIELELTLRQLAYRYRDFGPFEETLAKLEDRYVDR